MIDYLAARSAVETGLATMPTCFPGDAWMILDEYTIEREWGWVLFFDSRFHHETGDPQYAVAGNAPFIVRRSDGAVFETGTAHDVEHYIGEFERDGRLS